MVNYDRPGSALLPEYKPIRGAGGRLDPINPYPVTDLRQFYGKTVKTAKVMPQCFGV